MGYVGMILGFAIKFLIETILMTIILITKANKEIFFIPKASEIFRDFKEIIKFSLNFAIGYYTVSMTFELVSLILIKSENGKHHLLIWVSLAQLVNAIYYVGYGIGSYARALGNHFIGTQNPQKFKDALYSCLKYHFILTYIINIPFFIFANVIGMMFVNNDEDVKEFANYLRILSLFLPMDSMMPLLNSYMRLLGHNFFTMMLMIIGFACVIVATTFFLCLYFNAGTFGPVCGLVACNILVTSISLLRIYYNIDYYLNKVIVETNKNDMKNKDRTSNEFALSEDDSCTKTRNVLITSDTPSTEHE